LEIETLKEKHPKVLAEQQQTPAVLPENILTGLGEKITKYRDI
jgi:hypothetical protein